MCTARGVFPHGMCTAQGCTSELIPTDPNRSQSDLMWWGIFHRFSVWDKFSRSSSIGDKEHREPEPQDPRPLCADPTERYCTKDLRHRRDHLGAGFSIIVTRCARAVGPENGLPRHHSASCAVALLHRGTHGAEVAR